MDEKVRVTFVYDETSTKWEVRVSGCKDEKEAKQAFNAVVLTVKGAPIVVGLEHKVRTFPDLPAGTFELEPAVEGGYDSEFMSNPNLWPNWPILPLKKPGDWACLFEGGDGKYFIAYHQNMFEYPLSGEKWKWEATTVEKVLSEGWSVD